MIDIVSHARIAKEEKLMVSLYRKKLNTTIPIMSEKDDS
jgi:hypothetical protein